MSDLPNTPCEQGPRKPRILLNYYWDLNVRLSTWSGILPMLAKDAEVTIIVPPDVIDFAHDNLPPEIKIETTRYESQLDIATPLLRYGFTRRAARSFFNKVFLLTYAEDKNKSNATLKCLLHNHRKNNSSRTLMAKLRESFFVFVAGKACRSKKLRELLQRLYRIVYANDYHKDIIEKFQPHLCVIFSLCHITDGPFLVECKQAGVPTVSLIQSWDHTATKGYPHQHADSIILWSQAMAEECIHYHDFKPENINVEGVHIWDHYFNREEVESRDEFCAAHGLNPSKKILYVGLCGDSYHQGNLDLINLLSHTIQIGGFNRDCQVIFRTHPMYLQDEVTEQLTELLDLLKKRADKLPDIHVLNPLLDHRYPYKTQAEEDRTLLKNILVNCDICISVLSTQMVEACIMDKPAITLEYGQWTTNMISCPLEEYIREHLERIYGYNAISRVHSQEQLISCINSHLSGKLDLSENRTMLVSQEIQINKGISANCVVDRLLSLAKRSSHNRD